LPKGFVISDERLALERLAQEPRKQEPRKHRLVRRDVSEQELVVRELFEQRKPEKVHLRSIAEEGRNLVSSADIKEISLNGYISLDHEDKNLLDSISKDVRNMSKNFESNSWMGILNFIFGKEWDMDADTAGGTSMVNKPIVGIVQSIIDFEVEFNRKKSPPDLFQNAKVFALMTELRNHPKLKLLIADHDALLQERNALKPPPHKVGTFYIENYSGEEKNYKIVVYDKEREFTKTSLHLTLLADIRLQLIDELHDLSSYILFKMRDLLLALQPSYYLDRFLSDPLKEQFVLKQVLTLEDAMLSGDSVSTKISKALSQKNERAGSAFERHKKEWIDVYISLHAYAGVLRDIVDAEANAQYLGKKPIPFYAYHEIRSKLLYIAYFKFKDKMSAISSHQKDLMHVIWSEIRKNLPLPGHENYMNNESVPWGQEISVRDPRSFLNDLNSVFFRILSSSKISTENFPYKGQNIPYVPWEMMARIWTEIGVNETRKLEMTSYAYDFYREMVLNEFWKANPAAFISGEEPTRPGFAEETSVFGQQKMRAVKAYSKNLVERFRDGLAAKLKSGESSEEAEKLLGSVSKENYSAIHEYLDELTKHQHFRIWILWVMRNEYLQFCLQFWTHKYADGAINVLAALPLAHQITVLADLASTYAPELWKFLYQVLLHSIWGKALIYAVNEDFDLQNVRSKFSEANLALHDVIGAIPKYMINFLYKVRFKGDKEQTKEYLIKMKLFSSTLKLTDWIFSKTMSHFPGHFMRIGYSISDLESIAEFLHEPGEPVIFIGGNLDLAAYIKGVRIHGPFRMRISNETFSRLNVQPLPAEEVDKIKELAKGIKSLDEKGAYKEKLISRQRAIFNLDAVALFPSEAGPSGEAENTIPAIEENLEPTESMEEVTNLIESVMNDDEVRVRMLYHLLLYYFGLVLSIFTEAVGTKLLQIISVLPIEIKIELLGEFLREFGGVLYFEEEENSEWKLREYRPLEIFLSIMEKSSPRMKARILARNISLTEEDIRNISRKVWVVSAMPLGEADLARKLVFWEQARAFTNEQIPALGKYDFVFAERSSLNPK